MILSLFSDTHKEQIDPSVQQVDIFTFGRNGVINRSWGFETRSFTSQNMKALALTVPEKPEVVKTIYPHFRNISAAITVYCYIKYINMPRFNKWTYPQFYKISAAITV